MKIDQVRAMSMYVTVNYIEAAMVTWATMRCCVADLLPGDQGLSQGDELRGNNGLDGNSGERNGGVMISVVTDSPSQKSYKDEL